MNSNEKPKNPFLSVGGIIGAVIGYYCGIMLLIPAAISFVAVLILKNIDLPRFNPFKIAAAVVIGHTGWMAIGFILAKNVQAMAIVPDIALMIIGLAWLFANPGRGAVWYFTFLEGVTAVINLLNLLPQPFGSAAHKALVAHLCLRRFRNRSALDGIALKTDDATAAARFARRSRANLNSDKAFKTLAERLFHPQKASFERIRYA